MIIKGKTQEKRIDGRAIAQKILLELTEEVAAIKKKHNVTPCIEVIFVGDDPASQSFITQKKKAAETIGATMSLINLPATVTATQIEQVIRDANRNKHIHGIIIQRPLPKETPVVPSVLDVVTKEKDIDGFVPNSPFQVPVAHAVIAILEHMYTLWVTAGTPDFLSWLRTNTIVIIGKGVTAGKPIAGALEQLSAPFMVVDRSTSNPTDIIKKATIVISCIGQPYYIQPSLLRDGVMLISVGVRRVENKVIGDYDEDQVKEKALFYTPTPGGVGPVNVACLMQNLVKACKLQTEAIKP